MTATIHPIRPRRNPKCPDWCTRSDHFADDDDGPLHYGPSFGVFWAQARDGEPFEIGHMLPAFEGDFRIKNAEALRMIARDALALAEWLEAQRT
ncbi:MAG TPA: hypothetical protein VHO29_04050 [Marmoricola sp.]|nr:hypothetical protein [Marmoricola sp.]